MKTSILFKISKYRVHGFVSCIVLLSLFLFCSYQIGIKASGSKVFAGRVSSQLPMSLCTQYQYNICQACSQCGCGEWDEDTISPSFGTESNSTFYACKMPAYTPMGSGSLDPGSIVLGYCPSNELSSYDTSCNLWTTDASGGAIAKSISGFFAFQKVKIKGLEMP